MNEYVITFKYDNEGYMRHIVADCEDDAVGIAFARTRGMLKEFDAKNVTSLDVKEIGKKEIRAPSRLTFNEEDGEMPVLTSIPSPATPILNEDINSYANGGLNENFNRVTQEQYRSYQDQINARTLSITPAPTGQMQMSVPNNPGVYDRFVERLQQVPAWQPTPATWDAQGHPTTG